MAILELLWDPLSPGKKTEEPPSTKDQHINRSHFCFSNHFIHCLTQMKWLFQNLCGRNDSAYSVRECRIFLYMLYAMYVIISVLFKLFYMLMVGNEIFHSHRSMLLAPGTVEKWKISETSQKEESSLILFLFSFFIYLFFTETI